MTLPLRRVISGGQTGVDRGALDAAIAASFPHGGMCPRERRAEDGPIPERYDLTESGSPEYPIRTERNVADADATLILTVGAPTGGTRLTVSIARRLARPLRIVDLDEDGEAAADVVAWIHETGIGILNVAGPRESGVPGIAERAEAFMSDVLARLGDPIP
ncbi:MAG: molybdenum cofactor carrier [Planctomycetes bacterium]|nr:molybdenum cofactor carrier [Planctomycetota bacterium]